MNTWQKPEFTTICMNAEVGAYQEDFDGERSYRGPCPRGSLRDGSPAAFGGLAPLARAALAPDNEVALEGAATASSRAALEPASATACAELLP